MSAADGDVYLEDFSGRSSNAAAVHYVEHPRQLPGGIPAGRVHKFRGDHSAAEISDHKVVAEEAAA